MKRYVLVNTKSGARLARGPLASMLRQVPMWRTAAQRLGFPFAPRIVPSFPTKERA